jgi:flagellar basal body P-ring formation protein FlgA
MRGLSFFKSRDVNIAAAFYWAASMLCIDPAAAQTVLATIELPPAVIVNDPEVKLGQIARLTSTDLLTMQRLTTLPLGTMSVANEDFVLDRASIARWVRSQTGLRENQIVWSGEPAIKINLAGVSLPSSAVIEAAHASLIQWLSSHSERFEVRPISESKDLNIPSGPIRLSARPLLYERPISRMQVWVDLSGTAGVIRSVPVNFEVKAYTMATVAERDVSPGSAMTSSLSEREVELTGLASPSATPKGFSSLASGNLRFRRGLRAGDIVTTKDVEPIPVIQRGDWVVLRLVDGDVSMERRAEALQDGQIGQNIRVKFSSSDRSVLARVTNSGFVELAR